MEAVAWNPCAVDGSSSFALPPFDMLLAAAKAEDGSRSYEQLSIRPTTCLSPKTDSRPVQDRLPAVRVGRNFSAATSLDGRNFAFGSPWDLPFVLDCLRTENPYRFSCQGRQYLTGQPAPRPRRHTLSTATAHDTAAHYSGGVPRQQRMMRWKKRLFGTRRTVSVCSAALSASVV